MNHDNCSSIIKQIRENKIKYASQIESIDYLTDNIKKINANKILYLNDTIDRSQIVNKFTSILKNIEVAIKLEAGIFEFTLVYCTIKNYMTKLLPSVYNDKVLDLLANLDDNNSVANKTLKYSILNGNIDPQTVPFLKPQDLHPERWETIIKKQNLREEKKKNIATTDLYQCWKCKGRRCKMLELQTRSADESMTKFITCLDCYNVMKK